MKNQYFADFNDYKKYSLLRSLNNSLQGRILTAWLLTPDDGSSDGRNLGYLEKPLEYGLIEPDIFQSFHRCIEKGERSVRVVNDECYVPGMRCFDATLVDGANERQHYMDTLAAQATNYDLIFFDPDNGMEVQSVPYPKRGSSKYLYWTELRQFFHMGLSTLVYQHFPRVQRAPFIRRTAARMAEETGGSKIIVFASTWVAFFLAPQAHHSSSFNCACAEMEHKWGAHHIRTHIYHI